MSGGGLNDTMIHQWSIPDDKLRGSYKVGAQITGLFWSEATQEIVVSTGYPDSRIDLLEISDLEIVDKS